MDCLHVGFDGLDVAFQGYLPQSALDALERAREDAGRQMHPVSCKVGAVDMMVKATGTTGGYRYIGDTGDDGEIWFVKRSTDPGQWNMRVSVKSLPLAIYGFEKVVQRLYERIEAMGGTVLAESVGRVDLAADFVMPEDFRLEADAFVCHSHSTVSEHNEMPEAAIHFAGRRVTSVTVGKQPGRQIIVYNKRREIIQKIKPHWWDIWQMPQGTKANIWRVEVRAGKKHLKDAWGITTFRDLREKLGDVVREALRAVRYTDPADDEPNATRRRLHPLWEHAAMRFAIFLAGHSTGCAAGRRKVRGRRSVLMGLYLQQITGMVASYTAIYGGSDDAGTAIYRDIADHITDVIASDPANWHRRVERARSRMEIMEDWHECHIPAKTIPCSTGSIAG